MGKVLDMVTDRISTGGLLLVVSLYLPSLASFFILVFWLDIAAHWYHMYATVIRDSAHGSHKVIAGGDAGEGGLLSRVLRIYYHSKIAFVGCILANELLWILLVLRLGSPSLQLSSPASSLVSSLPIIPTAAVPPSVRSAASALPAAVRGVGGRIAEYAAGVHAAAGAFDSYLYYNSWTCVVDAGLLVCVPLWAVKQLTNVAMLVRGAAACNTFDAETKGR